MSYIVCKDVAFSYENQIVVSGLSFQVDAGDYLCIIGENGTGKTTLMKGLLGLKKLRGHDHRRGRAEVRPNRLCPAAGCGAEGFSGLGV